MNSRRKLTYLFLSITIVAVVLIQDRVVFRIQKLFCITSCPVNIGLASVAPPDNWLLASSRDSEHGDVYYYGVIPQWIFKKKSYPETRFFSYRAPEGNRSSITVIEMDNQTKTKMRSIKGEYTNNREGGCEPQNKMLDNFDVFVCSNKDFYVILIPDLEITIIPFPSSPDALQGLKLTRLKH